MNNLISLITIVIFLMFILYLALIFLSYKKVPKGKVIVRSGFGGDTIAFNSGLFIVPVLHTKEIVDLTIKNISISLSDKDNIITKDNIYINLKAEFLLLINREKTSVITAINTFGAENLSEISKLETVFKSNFTEALKESIKQMTFEEIKNNTRDLKYETLNIIGVDLYGFSLQDCIITEIKKINN